MEPKTFQKYLENLNKVSSIMSYKNDEEKIITNKEKATLETLQRGLYAKINLKKGEILTDKNTYLAFPLQKKTISCEWS